MTKPFTSLWRPRHLMDTYPRLGTSWSLATERPLPLAQMSPPSPWAISILQALARLQNKTRAKADRVRGHAGRARRRPRAEPDQ